MVRSNVALSLLAGASALTEAARTPKKQVPGSYIVEYDDGAVGPTRRKPYGGLEKVN